MRFPMLSHRRGCQGQFKCRPHYFSRASRSGSDAPRFESNAAVVGPVRLSVFFGLEIGLQWVSNPYTASRPPVLPPPPSPPPRGPHESVAPPKDPLPPPPPPPRVIRQWREPGCCAGRAGAAQAGIAGHLQICSQMHMQHRRGAGLPYLTAP